jgi:hypothetical protein
MFDVLTPVAQQTPSRVPPTEQFARVLEMSEDGTASWSADLPSTLELHRSLPAHGETGLLMSLDGTQLSDTGS